VPVKPQASEDAPTADMPEPIAVQAALQPERSVVEVPLDSLASTPTSPPVGDALDGAPGRWGRSGRMWLALGLAGTLLASWSALRHKHAPPESASVTPIVASAPSAAALGVRRPASAPLAGKPSAQAPQREASRAAMTGKPDGAPATEAPAASKKEVKRADASGFRNPRQACGDRMFITRAICMKRLCAKPAYTGHPECDRMREQESSQRNPY